VDHIHSIGNMKEQAMVTRAFRDLVVVLVKGAKQHVSDL
jgi:hypothetical protein